MTIGPTAPGRAETSVATRLALRCSSMPNTELSLTLQAAQEHAAAALEVLQRLKTGSWESVQALALVSIAESLLVLAARSQASGE